jgi:hypothetical protein
MGKKGDIFLEMQQHNRMIFTKTCIFPLRAYLKLVSLQIIKLQAVSLSRFVFIRQVIGVFTIALTRVLLPMASEIFQ